MGDCQQIENLNGCRRTGGSPQPLPVKLVAEAAASVGVAREADAVAGVEVEAAEE